MSPEQTEEAGPSRRVILQSLVALPGLGLLAAGLPAPVLAATAAGDFTAVSRALTERDSLSPALGEAIHTAFLAQNAQFDTQLARLAALLATPSAEPLQARLTGANADLAPLPGAILTAWYLGIVGHGEAARCVAYRDDLANQLVSDKLHPPSYAYGAYGSWAAKPV